MRINLLANRDLASIVAINLLLQRQPNHQYRIFLSSKVGGKKSPSEPLRQLSFFEQTLFNDILFPALASRTDGLTSKLLTFEELTKRGISVNDIDDINSPHGLQKMAAGKPILGISIRFGQILSNAVIAIPEYGVLNLHSGILPQYRGVMGTFWSMLNNEKEMGTTLHFITDEGIDTGDIIAVNRQLIVPKQSYLANVLSLYPSGIESLSHAMDNLAANQSIDTDIQTNNAGQYYSFPKDADLQQFSDQGLHLFRFDEIIKMAQQFY